MSSNAFGNVIVRALDGRIWRISPEELFCEVIASSESTYRALEAEPEFLKDWHMTRLVEVASSELGPLSEGRCYCLKLPGPLGGTYDSSNLGTIAVSELLASAGQLAWQIKDVPDGAKIELSVE